MLNPATASHIVCSLEQASRANPGTPKLLVARVLRTGQELLERLGEQKVATDGWKPSTARNLAYGLVAKEIEQAGLRLADDLDETALLDHALDLASADLQDSRFAMLAESPGFRRAAQEATRTLRLAGVSSEQLAEVPLTDKSRQQLLVRTLAEYEAGLQSAKLADLAEVFRRAVAALDAGRLVAGTQLYLVPGFRMRGWAGRFVAGLRAQGAEILAGDPTVGMEPEGPMLWQAADPVHPLSWLHAPAAGAPSTGPELFAAASPQDELREVLRRFVAMGLPWNQVEIITADPSYPALLDGLARRLGIPVEYATGLPAVRTPAGRAVAQHLAGWEAKMLGKRTSAAAVAASAAEFLNTLPTEPVQQLLLGRARRIAATLHRQTSSAAAVRSVAGRLDLHVTPSADDQDIPSVGSGGLLLSDIQHGGRCGRTATFVVGLSAEVFPGAGIQDPMLPDEDRRRIGAAIPEVAPGLPTATERLAERRHALAATLAGLRGQVTLSYPGWNPGEARRVDPTAIVLQAFRVREGNPTLDYDKLRTALGGLCGPVPRSAARLDASDVWLASLRGGAAPVDGTVQVRDAFKGLGAGFRARHALASSEPTPHHGVVTPQPERWDPRLNPNLFVSASRLETLGRCPHQYLLKYVLRVRIPDGPAGPDVWLAPNHRGTLLHDVFDLTLTEARDKGIAPLSPHFAELALTTLERAAEAMRAEVVPPSELVFRRELEDMRRDVQVWIASMNEADVEWVECEMEFGPGKHHPAVSVQLPGGTFRILGAIDRVDRLPGGKLRIVDYKTGSPAKYGRESGVFDGGRRLQHFVYSRAAEALLGAPVDRMEYHFPTERGQNGRRAFASAELEPAAEMLDGLMDLVARGQFLPTEEKNDCRFCDYKNVCRVQCDDHGKVVVSPLADWAATHSGSLDSYVPLLRARSAEG